MSARGDAGTDTVTYDDRGDGVAITLAAGATNNGNANDGAENARDRYTSVERLSGGSGNDVITGDGAINRLDGGRATTSSVATAPVTTFAAARATML